MNVIVDYGMGNLRNVRRAFEAVGVKVLVTGDPVHVKGATRIILPGVGAFGEAVRRIDSLGLRGPLVQQIAAGTPLLGICLGMQLLFQASEESPGSRGLGVLGGTVHRFGGTLKVPHIGWNTVDPTRTSTLFPEKGKAGCFYFVHSFFVSESETCTAVTDYGVNFVSAVERDRLFGVQFHPEKSQDEGQVLLKNFLGVS